MQRIIRAPAWFAAATLAFALVAGGITGSMMSGGTNPAFTAAASTETQTVFDQGFSPVVKIASPAVVNISSSRVVRTPEGGPESPFLNDPFLRRFFSEEFLQQHRVPRERRERSLGSGVIVNSNGYILTNSHVIDGATDIKVVLSDNREMTGKLVGSDPGTDLAVIKVDTDHLPTISFGDSDKVQVGDICLAIGDPFGVGRTVTMGIVSATGRGGLGIEDYEDFIQTDASINPGNSGGALINGRGQLIGVNTAILSPSGGNLGIGFAVPSNMARTVMEQIIRTGKVTRGYMGVGIQDITPELAAAMKLGQTHGALVGDVDPNGPAARTGLQKGDVIVEVNRKPIDDSRDLRLTVSSLAPNSKVDLRFVHEGQTRNASITLGEVPVEKEAAITREKPTPPEPSLSQLGIALTELTPDIAEQLKLPSGTPGIAIVDVQDGSPAADAGLQPGDVIQEVNRVAVRNVAEFQTALRKRVKGPLLLLINREGHTRYAALE